MLELEPTGSGLRVPESGWSGPTLHHYTKHPL